MHETIFNFWHLRDPELPLNVIMSGISYCDHSYRIERRGENLLSFEYIIEGSGVLEINGQTVHPQKNDVYILTKQSDHLYYSSHDRPWTKIWILFQGAFAESLFQQYLPADTYIIKNCNILPYMNEMIRLSSAKQMDYSRFIDEVSIILLKIVLRLKNQLSYKTLTVAEQIKSCLDANVENRMDLNDLCIQLGYSKNHLIKLFRASYGLTPYAYFRQRKIELAKQYLLNTHLAIHEVSEKLNFADQHYFSTAFKSVVGVSPSAYRNHK